MKATLSEIKKNPQGTNSEGKEARVQINDLEHKEEINSQPAQNEETRIQKNEDRLRNLQETLNIPTSESRGCQKEKRKSKKLKTYLNK